MEYQCKTVPLVELLVGHKGLIHPLCDTCKTRDCTNPIELRMVSVFGVNQEHKLYMMRESPHVVIECNDGYSK
jgi:hypothetical protein